MKGMQEFAAKGTLYFAYSPVLINKSWTINILSLNIVN